MFPQLGAYFSLKSRWSGQEQTLINEFSYSTKVYFEVKVYFNIKEEIWMGIVNSYLKIGHSLSMARFFDLGSAMYNFFHGFSEKLLHTFGPILQHSFS